MKKEWSMEWKSSVQPRKQRKYRYNAPLHVKRKFLGARLSPDLSKQFGRRSMPLRKGDEIRVLRGKLKGKTGVIERINVKETKIYVEGITAKKVDGSEVMRALQPSNLMITKPNMDDKKRQISMDRAGGKKDEKAKTAKTVQKKETKKAEKPKEAKPAKKEEAKK